MSSQILFISNITDYTKIYPLFSKYGEILQYRIGNTKDTIGTAFVIYKTNTSAEAAKKSLNGFLLCGKCLHIRHWYLSDSKTHPGVNK